MPARAVTDADLHAFSQLVYLDAVPTMAQNGAVTVRSLAAYYLYNPLGVAYLRTRFGGIAREYEMWPPFLARCETAYGDWTLTDLLDDNAPRQSGLYGCAFRAPEGCRVVAFRGSELLGNQRYRNDYETNLALAYEETTPQQAMVDAYWRHFGGMPGPWYITGHSLGGNLACYGAVAAPEDVRGRLMRCAAFNAPGFNDAFIQEKARAIAGVEARLALYQNEYDIVSSLLFAPVAPAIVESLLSPMEEEPFSLDNLMYPHSNFMFRTDARGEFVLTPGQRKCMLCRLAHQVSVLLLRLPVSVRQGMAALLLGILYNTPQPEDARRYALEALLKYLSRHNAVTGDDLDTTVLDEAQALTSAPPEALCREACAYDTNS